MRAMRKALPVVGVLLCVVALAWWWEKRAQPIPANAFVNSLGMPFVPVPGTDVQFCIWETRVKDYAAYAAANAGVDGSWTKPRDWTVSFSQADTHPVVMVNWKNAREFCTWLTRKERAEGKITASQHYRLPTDAEWSVAVGLSKETGDTPYEKDGGIKGIYPWGKEWPPPNAAGNYHQYLKVDKFEYTSPVGSFAANPHGIHDLGGNVWEWCDDYYMPNSPALVLRDVSWRSDQPEHLLSSFRGGAPFRFSGPDGGFRCVLAKGPGPKPKQSEPPRSQPKSGGKKSIPTNAFVNTLGMPFVPLPETKVQFCIWETRVKDYAAYAAAKTATKASVDSSWKSFGRGFRQAKTHPVVNVNWNDARAFCAWLTEKEQTAGKLKAGQRYRLPTDAEWSVAVGLGNETGNSPKEKQSGIKDVYPWGTSWPPPREAGNYSQRLQVDRFEYTSPVGSFAANQLGIHDLGGNVYEWCGDWFDPAVKEARVLRGVSWTSRRPDYLLSSFRNNGKPHGRNAIIGFRCVLAGE